MKHPAGEALSVPLGAGNETPRDGLDAVVAEDFERFYREHARYVAGLAYRLVGARAEVDDVVQEVFLAAYRGIGALRDASKTRAWLATLAVRIARKRIRRQRFWSWLRGAEAVDADELAASAPSPADRAVLALVYRAAARLAVEDRLAWTLRVVEGHELEAVAEMCECSLATVKRRVSRAQESVERVLRDG